MAREITPEDWPARIADAEIASVVGSAAFGRGRRYADERRVANLSVSGNGEILAAAVRGAQGRIYQTMVYARSSGERVSWSGTCSCPVGGNCKHTAALVLTARRQARASAAPPGDADWERRLTQLLRTRQNARRAVAIEVADTETARAGAGSHSAGRFGFASARPGRLHLRPLIAGKRGWVKQGISWRGLMNGDLTGEVAPEVLAALAELAAMDPYGDYYYSNSVIDLGALPARVWDVLRRAVAAGVTLTTAQRSGSPVRILSGLRAGVGVRRQADGTALIRPALDFDAVAGLVLGEGRGPEARALGDPTHAYALAGTDGALNLMPLEPPPGEVLGRLLSRHEQVTIPAADVERFEREHLGRIASVLPIVDLDPSLSVPDVGTPVAVLHVGLDAAAHRAETSWSIRYLTAAGSSCGEVAVGGLAELLTGPGPLEWRDPVGASGMAGTGADDESRSAVVAESDSGRRLDQAPSTRDAEAEDRLARRIIDACTPLVPTHGRLWQPGSFTAMNTARLITRALPVLEGVEGVVVEISGRVPDYREAEETPLITTAVEDDDEHLDWFSLRVRVRVGQEDVPIERLMTAVAQGTEEVLLDSGKWINLTDRPEIVRLARLMEEGRDLRDPHSRSAGDLAVTAFQAGLYAELEQLGVIGEATRRWREGVERLLAVTSAAEAGSGPGGGTGTGDASGASGTAGLLDAPVPEGLRAQLRPYQLDGYRWLALLQSTGLGGILADDMGLGKTVQVLAVVQRMVEQRTAGVAAAQNGAADGEASPQPGALRDGPVLVVAPTSVVGAWAEQAARFCPDLRVRAINRTRAKRDESLEEIRSDADLVVTSYTIARIEEEDFTAVDWAWVVLDEAQFVKNHNAVTYKAMRRLRTPSTVAITGTPLENSLMDLWSLLSITAPGLLPGPDRFAELYRRPVEHGDDSALASLRARIRPFLLRRTKEAVAADLPAKNEQILSVELAPGHRRAYDRRLARERQKVLGLLEEDTAQSRFTALKSLTILRQMALDPALVEGPDAEELASGRRGTALVGEAEAGSTGSGRAAVKRRRSRPTAKVEVLLETLQPVVAEGHRALVFSQFTRYLAGVRQALEAAGMRTAYLDGTTTNRQEVIDAFRGGDAEVFLISLKAGGFGLTLTEADYVFLLDPWWNPQAEEQAVDRTHRIGQDKPVMVYRLVSAGTIEEKVMALKEKKAELFDRVVEGSGDGAASPGAASAGRARLTAQEIRELLGGE
ncbi:Helicase conserved C-terminal domain-containing protein [Actinomyces ruminicola]|uniref:Helicase conserved C-terminal domain-containing protein n=1 Tax=Actinomyces ruminicola TaxID=332524 RepID=A0A1H0DDY2_9ACTO|nr:DEAD/DEAH box helicase [Actinomyces ruminicola]SDN68332.1 Helicase conserved C-terminal domain-containing protein [Actinomyces ruminicola]